MFVLFYMVSLFQFLIKFKLFSKQVMTNVEKNGVIAIANDTIIPSTRSKPYVVYYL